MRGARRAAIRTEGRRAVLVRPGEGAGCDSQTTHRSRPRAIREGREKAVQQIPVSGMDFYEPEPRVQCSSCSIPPLPADSLDVRAGQRSRSRVAIGKGHVANSHRLPAAVFQRNCLPAQPRWGCRGLPAGVSELDPGHRTVLGDEPSDSPPRPDVFVLPDPGVGRRDAALGRNGRRFGHHEARSAHGPRAEVDEVPIGDEPVIAAVYWHIGETPMRLRSVTERRESGSNKCTVCISNPEPSAVAISLEGTTTVASEKPPQASLPGRVTIVAEGNWKSCP